MVAKYPMARGWVVRRLHHDNARHRRYFTNTSRVSLRSPAPAGSQSRLQRIQNSVARIVWQQPSLSSRDTFQQLHWLPVKWRIQFKLASLTYKVLHTGNPSYLSERLHPYVPSRTLRSSSSANLYIPRTNLHFGSRSFHIAAPTVWNSLPSTLRSSQTLNTFRKLLKTRLFRSAFNSPYSD